MPSHTIILCILLIVLKKRKFYLVNNSFCFYMLFVPFNQFDLVWMHFLISKRFQFHSYKQVYNEKVITLNDEYLQRISFTPLSHRKGIYAPFAIVQEELSFHSFNDRPKIRPYHVRGYRCTRKWMVINNDLLFIFSYIHGQLDQWSFWFHQDMYTALNLHLLLCMCHMSINASMLLKV